MQIVQFVPESAPGVPLTPDTTPVGVTGSAAGRISTNDAGELVHAVVRSRLQLVPVVHAVIALVLRVVRQRSAGVE